MERIRTSPFLLNRFTFIDKLNNGQTVSDLITECNWGVAKKILMLKQGEITRMGHNYLRLHDVTEMTYFRIDSYPRI